MFALFKVKNPRGKVEAFYFHFERGERLDFRTVITVFARSRESIVTPDNDGTLAHVMEDEPVKEATYIGSI